jgi:transposase-like protein
METYQQIQVEQPLLNKPLGTINGEVTSTSMDPQNNEMNGPPELKRQVNDVNSNRRYYPRELKRAVVQEVIKGGHCRAIANKYGLRSPQVVYSFLHWYRHQGNHGHTMHSLASFLSQKQQQLSISSNDHQAQSPQEFEKDKNGDWFTTSEASDNLKMLDQLKFVGSKEGNPPNRTLGCCGKHIKQQIRNKGRKVRTTKTAHKKTKPTAMGSKRLKRSVNHTGTIQKRLSKSHKINVVPK